MKGRVGELNNHSKQFGGSQTAGGQAPVHHQAMGDRRGGQNAARGHVSPIGGAGSSIKNASAYEEKKNRAQTPISRSGVLDRFHR